MRWQGAVHGCIPRAVAARAAGGWPRGGAVHAVGARGGAGGGQFFLSQATFDEEFQLCAEDNLGSYDSASMMPVMREAVRAGQVRSRSGFAFPAFPVLERGESLQDWRRNVQPQMATVVDERVHFLGTQPCRLTDCVSLCLSVSDPCARVL